MKILVTYVSICESTQGVAQAIAEERRALGDTVALLPLSQVDDLSAYDAIIIGSAIRMGAWLREAVNFVQTHQKTLQNTFTAYFTVCITLNEDTPENREEVSHYIDPVVDIVRPDAAEFFAGVMDLSKLNFLERMTVKSTDTPVGDFRDWDAIRGWARSLQPTAKVV